MNTQNNNFATKFNKSKTQKITTSVNETIEACMCQAKSFTNADLWKILRLKRSPLQRRNYA
jgi:hypothetical protein